MTTTTTEGLKREPSRLDPFALPTETSVRFTLLLFGTAGIALCFAQLLKVVLRLVSGDAAFFNRGPQDPTLVNIGADLRTLAFPFMAIVVVFLVAWIGYRRQADRVARMLGYTDRLTDVDAQVAKASKELAVAYGIEPAPECIVNDVFARAEMNAYGHSGHEVIGMDKGVRMLFRKNRLLFETKFLHELGHIKNGDVRRAYFAYATWRAVLFVLVLPFVAVAMLVGLVSVGRAALSGSSAADMINLLAMNMLGVAVLFLVFAPAMAVLTVTWRGLLRVREFFADQRAAQWGGQAELERYLDDLDKTATKHPKYPAFWRFHPTNSERLAVIQDPARLFRIHYVVPLTCGMLSAYLAAGLNTVIYRIAAVFMDSAYVGTSSPLGATFANILLLAVIFVTHGYLCAGTLGTEVQRASLLELWRPGKRRRLVVRLGLSALLFVVGYELGALTAPPYFLSPIGILLMGGGTAPVLLLSLWHLSFVVGIWITLIVAMMISKMVFAHHSDAQQLGRRALAINLVLTSIFACANLAANVFRLAILQPDPLATTQMTGAAFTSLRYMVALLVLAPLATYLYTRYRRRTHSPSDTDWGELGVKGS